MQAQEDFIELAAPFRGELIAHCYRMLGSVHDAEDLVQETYLRGWRGYQTFEERAALRTWLYRIATNACLRALESRARRVLPAGLGDASSDPGAGLEGTAGNHEWLEPLPDTFTPETAFNARQSVRLAVMTALQELPTRQRAVLILRDVVQFSAAEVAELLETTPAAVNSSLQRARAHLAEVAPAEESVTEPGDAERRALLDRYCAAFENADMAALTELLQADVKLEMPPMPVWFNGRDTVVRIPCRARLRQTRRGGADPDCRERATRGGRIPAHRRPRHAGPFHTCAHTGGHRDRRDHRLPGRGPVRRVRSSANPVGFLTVSRCHRTASLAPHVDSSVTPQEY